MSPIWPTASDILRNPATKEVMNALVTADDIGWANYSGFEGPFFRGRQRYLEKSPAFAEENDRWLTIITATEGGTWDAVNMYDSCIVTVGLIQWCERGMFGVSNMLGAVRDRMPSALDLLPCPFTRTGKFRFLLDEIPVETDAQMRLIYFGGPDFRARMGDARWLAGLGRKGSWNAEQRAQAKTWAAAFANVFSHEPARDAQAKYTTDRLMGFFTGRARRILWDGTETPRARAMRALYLSFAANMPAYADASLAAASETSAVKYSDAWFNRVLGALVYDRKIAIYPQRYNRIRPFVERLYGVDIPDLAVHLARAESDGWTMTVLEIQNRLSVLGYDPGPRDGKDGPKTRNAVRQFQADRGLEVDGVVGPKTVKALRT